MNAPEIYGKKELGEWERGHAALAYAKELAPIGTPVVIETQKDRTSFGRYVATIRLPDGNDFALQISPPGTLNGGRHEPADRAAPLDTRPRRESLVHLCMAA